MPVKSSHSSVIRWPDRETVRKALVTWVEEQRRTKPELLRAGYFGSYARGNWGVGSDLDVILIVRGANAPFLQRGLAWDLTSLPVPVDVVVYTIEEWEAMVKRGDHFTQVVEAEAVWL